MARLTCANEGALSGRWRIESRKRLKSGKLCHSGESACTSGLEAARGGGSGERVFANTEAAFVQAGARRTRRVGPQAQKKTMRAMAMAKTTA